MGTRPTFHIQFIPNAFQPPLHTDAESDHKHRSYCFTSCLVELRAWVGVMP